MVVVVSQLYAFVKTRKIVKQKGEFYVCKLCLNNSVFQSSNYSNTLNKRKKIISLLREVKEGLSKLRDISCS